MITSKKNYEHILLYCIFVTFVFLFYRLSGNIIIWYFGVVALIAAVFFFGLENFLLMALFLFPNENIFKQIGLASSTLSYIYLAVSLLYVLSALIKTKKIDLFIVLFSVLHFLDILVCGLRINNFDLISPYIRFILFVLSFYLFFQFNINKQALIDFFVFGVGIAILTGIIYHSINGTIFNGYFGGISGDRNYFNAIVSICISLCVLYIINSDRLNGKEKILYLIVLFLCILSVILSQSRTCYIAFIFPLLCIIIHLFNSKKVLHGISILVVLSVFAFIIVYFFRDTFTGLIERMNQDDLYDGNGRFEIWTYYMTEWLHSGFLGLIVGLGSSNLIYNAGIYANFTHNTVVEYLYATGLLGSISIFLVIMCVYKIIVGHQKKIKFVSLIPLLNLIFCYLGIDALYSNALMIGLIVCFICVAQFSTEKKKFISKV